MNVFKKLLLSFLFAAVAVNPLFAATEQPVVRGLDDEEASGGVVAAGASAMPEIKNVVINTDGKLNITLKSGASKALSQVTFKLADGGSFELPVAYLAYAPMLKILIETSMRGELELSEGLLVVAIDNQAISSKVFKQIVGILKELSNATKNNEPLFLVIKRVTTGIVKDIDAQLSFLTKYRKPTKLKEFMYIANYFGGAIAKIGGLVVAEQFNTVFSNKKSYEDFITKNDISAIQEAFVITYKQAPFGMKFDVSNEALSEWGILPDTLEVRNCDAGALIDLCFPIKEVKEAKEASVAPEVKAGEVQGASETKVLTLRDQVQWSALPTGKLNELFKKRLPEYIKKNAGKAEFQEWLDTVKDPYLLKLVHQELLECAEKHVKQAGFIGQVSAVPEGRYKMALRMKYYNEQSRHCDNIKLPISLWVGQPKQISVSFERLNNELPNKNLEPYLSDILFLLEPMLPGKEVVKLSLADNDLKELPESIINSLPHLKELNITGNQFTSIPHCLSELQQRGITIIGLESNRINPVELAMFKAQAPFNQIKQRSSGATTKEFIFGGVVGAMLSFGITISGWGAFELLHSIVGESLFLVLNRTVAEAGALAFLSAWYAKKIMNGSSKKTAMAALVTFLAYVVVPSPVHTVVKGLGLVAGAVSLAK